MKLKFLLIGTSLSLISNLTYAQCSPAQSCTELGYKEAANKGGCLKCPFGNSWYCPPPKEEKAVLGECTGYAKNCKIGNILNSDGTCTANKENGKTPLGVVVYIGGDNCGQALALTDLGEMPFSTKYPTILNLPPYHSSSDAEQDFDSCGNTENIVKLSSSYTYPEEAQPAVWAVVNYAPSSAPVTKGKWCLPAAGVARSMMNNYSVINSGLSQVGGELLPTKSNHGHWNWSSTGTGATSNAWGWCYACDKVNDRIEGYYIIYNAYVRPVIEF